PRELQSLVPPGARLLAARDASQQDSQSRTAHAPVDQSLHRQRRSLVFDHVTLTVSDVPRAVRFYTEVLAPLGYRLEQEYDSGAPGNPQLWLQAGTPQTVHLAFRAGSRTAVTSFHSAAIAAGGRDNGGAGLRESYGPTYFAAFALDPDGNNVEAVTHEQ